MIFYSLAIYNDTLHDQTLDQINTSFKIMRGFLRIFVTDVARRQGTLTPRTLYPVPFGPAYVLPVETNPFTELVVIFPD